MPRMIHVRFRLFPSLALTLGLFACATSAMAEETAGKDPASPPAAADPSPQQKLNDAIQNVKMPGIVINAQERYVDVSAQVCLDEGALELIACTKDTKEHESIVLIQARPSHIHAALLLLGAKNGNPAMRRALDPAMTQWEDLPPKGDPIYVSLAWKKEDGALVERPLGDFLKRTAEEDGVPVVERNKKKFPEFFVFAGSHLGDASETPRKYFADLSGHAISISTFGDELLCLPDFHGQENEALAWSIDPTHLPKRHSDVLLRLRVKKQQP